jgi:hypothetical protein
MNRSVATNAKSVAYCYEAIVIYSYVPTVPRSSFPEHTQRLTPGCQHADLSQTYFRPIPVENYSSLVHTGLHPQTSPLLWRQHTLSTSERVSNSDTHPHICLPLVWMVRTPQLPKKKPLSQLQHPYDNDLSTFGMPYTDNTSTCCIRTRPVCILIMVLHGRLERLCT